MALTLRIENYDVLENGGPTSITLQNKGCSVGRNSSNDWVLPDPSRHISSHHFDVAFDKGRYWLTDMSTNGTFLYEQKYRIEGRHELKNGQRFTVGHYVIIAEISDRAAAQPRTEGLQMPPSSQPPSGGGADEDVWDAFGGPVNEPVSPLPRAGGTGARMDDAAREFVPVSSPPSNISPAVPRGPMPQMPPGGFAAQMPPSAPSGFGGPSPQMPPAAMPRPVIDPNSVPPQQPVVPGAPAAPPDAVVAAFCAGAGLNPQDYPGIDAATLAHDLGKCIRSATEEIMAMLQDRATVKHFTKGGERTMRSATGNNPMKFLPEVDQALETMFFKPRDGFMKGPDGFENALKDIRMHQAAVFAALQPALVKLLSGLAPDEIVEESGSGLLGGSSRAKAWETYVERWDEKAEAGDNGMLDTFLEAFANAYSDASAKG